mmetsp:Transcript_106/g.226  ORF Transcript_106/g.226 Transcript_106/m.226 type:complete len:321 (+) Transcript_106:317-1279(+)
MQQHWMMMGCVHAVVDFRVVCALRCGRMPWCGCHGALLDLSWSTWPSARFTAWHAGAPCHCALRLCHVGDPVTRDVRSLGLHVRNVLYERGSSNRAGSGGIEHRVQLPKLPIEELPDAAVHALELPQQRTYVRMHTLWPGLERVLLQGGARTLGWALRHGRGHGRCSRRALRKRHLCLASSERPKESDRENVVRRALHKVVELHELTVLQDRAVVDAQLLVHHVGHVRRVGKGAHRARLRGVCQAAVCSSCLEISESSLTSRCALAVKVATVRRDAPSLLLHSPHGLIDGLQRALLKRVPSDGAGGGKHGATHRNPPYEP